MSDPPQDSAAQAGRDHDAPQRTPRPASEGRTDIDERGDSTMVPIALDEAAFPVGSKIARYTVLEAIGSGGVGIVYACYDADLDRKVAVKLLRPSKLAGRPEAADIRKGRLLREAQALARLSHPNVVPIYEVGTVHSQGHGQGQGHSQIYLVMEFVEGTTLAGWLTDQRRGWAEVVAMFVQAGRGLAAAHAAGIVHRDFKPENVLVGNDGRVRVLDFGLAAPLRPGESGTHEREDWREDWRGDDSDDSGPRDELIEMLVANARDQRTPQAHLVTREGQVMGTPAYMAPEQAAGGSVDARSDQFSFCVAIYEAIYGVRPFRGRFDDARRYRDLGRLRQLPGTRPADLPVAIERTLVRGLALLPEQRHDDMDALLAELTGVADAPGHLWWVPASILTLALVSLLFFVLGRKDNPGCDDGAELLAAVWRPQVSDEFRQRAVASGLPYAEANWTGIAGDLDRWSASWRQSRLQACEARARGDQSDDMLERRMACLDRQLVRFDSVLTGLREHPGAAEDWLARMSELDARLPDPGRCDAVTILNLRERSPADPRQAATVERLRTRLAEVDGLSDAASYVQAIELGEQVLQEARTEGFDALTAEALASLGGALEGQDLDSERAAALLQEGALLAQASGSDEAFVRIASVLVRHASDAEAKYELAELWGALAAATLTRVGEDPELEIELRFAMGNLAMEKGDFADAFAAHERVRELISEHRGEGHPSQVRALRAIGDDLRELGRSDEAAEVLERARAQVTAAYGPKHPDVAATLVALATVRADQRRFDEAIALATEALQITEALRGPEHHTVANVLNNLAIIYDQMGRYDEAVRTLERAYRLQLARFGPDHPDVAFVAVNLGSALQNLARYDEAIIRYQGALAVLQDSMGPEHVAVGITLQNLASAFSERGQFTGEREDFAAALVEFDAAEAVLVATVGREHPATASLESNRAGALRGLDRLDEALAAAQRAVDINEAIFGHAHPQLVPSLTALSRVELALAHPRRARELAERAVTLSGEGNSPSERAEAELALAEAMVAGGEGDQLAAARARELARAALAEISEAEGAMLVRRQLQDWLAAHGDERADERADERGDEAEDERGDEAGDERGDEAEL